MNNKKDNDQDIPKEQPIKEEKTQDNSSAYKIFPHGFGGVVLISLSTFSPNANAGSAVFGPCGVHYT